MKLLLTPDAPAANGAPATDWTTGFPDDLKATVAATGWKGPVDMAKSYANVVKLVGNNIEIPKPDWDEKKLGEFYAKVGRPETPDKYTMPDDLIKKSPVPIAPEKLTKWREHLHKQGLTDRQAKGLMEQYLTDEFAAVEATQAQDRAQREAAEMKLRNDWSGKYEDNLKVASSAIKRLAGPDWPEFEKFLNESKLGNHPVLVKMFHNVGSRMGEDSAVGGGAPTGGTDAGSALAEIGKLQGDKQFWDALNNRMNPGHAAAVERYSELFRIAHGTAPVQAT